MKPALFSALLVSVALASPAHASPETCAKIEKMLVSVQLNTPNLSDSDFVSMNESLKKAHMENCEKENSEGLLSEAIETVKTYDNGTAIEKDGRFYTPDGREFLEEAMGNDDGILEDAVSNNSARILQPFLAGHARCAPGCSYVSWGIWGDARHQAKRSCHNSGEAIDIHAISCGGRTYPSLSGRFNEYVSCMKGSFGVIYGSGDHRDHAHIQLPNCQFCAGLNCSGNRQNLRNGPSVGPRHRHVVRHARHVRHRRHARR